ncbi:hypothetical protein [Glaciecola sp. 1036]|uniref:hypothetical protein n=1 Tax=Alteromonadaceae TaxID=72275 RepID=UPI003D092F99
MEDSRYLHKQVFVFLLITLFFSALAFSLLHYLGKIELIILYMICPGLAAILTKLVFKEPLSTFAIGLGRAKFLAVGYLIPLVYLLPVYLIVWLIFNNFPNSEYVAELITVMPNMTEAKAILFIVGASATLGVLGTAITGALGEELGWRGFLVPKLLQIHSFHKPLLGA